MEKFVSESETHFNVLSSLLSSNEVSSNNAAPYEADAFPGWTENKFENSNSTTSEQLGFNEGHAISIFTYSLLMLISSIGNISVLKTIIQLRRNSSSTSRINVMLMHLAIADLLVTFLMMPIEILWAATVKWIFGETLCRIGAFFRIFGLYLSSFIIICISIDRYLAVLKPMNLYHIDYRGKIMVTIAWIASAICSFPQILIFHVEQHPDVKQFEQCVALNAFSSRFQELMYLYLSMVIMYCLPLCVIIFCYTSIIFEIQRQSAVTMDIRRSGLGALGQAKTKTLKMTITIVVVFLVCWTPYYVMCIWFWTDPDSAKKVDYKIQRALFLFASTNSCANPIVYSIFNIRKRRHINTQIRSLKNNSAATPYFTDMRLPQRTLSLRSEE